MLDVLKYMIKNIYMHINDLFKEREEYGFEREEYGMLIKYFFISNTKQMHVENFGGISRGDVLRIIVT